MTLWPNFWISINYSHLQVCNWLASQWLVQSSTGAVRANICCQSRTLPDTPITAKVSAVSVCNWPQINGLRNNQQSAQYHTNTKPKKSTCRQTVPHGNQPANHITVGNCSWNYNDVPRPCTIGRAYSTKSSINTGQAPTDNMPTIMHNYYNGTWYST